jgi:transmembrane sensor
MAGWRFGAAGATDSMRAREPTHDPAHCKGTVSKDPKPVRRIDPALSQAVEWMVLLRSGQASSRERAAFEAWRTADPAHDAACERVNGALGAVGVLRERGVSGVVAHQAVQGMSRRSVTRATLSLAGLGAGLGAGLLGWQVAGEQGLLADQHTGFAQRRQEALPDGSTLMLDARTALDVAAQPGQRTLTLHHGRMLVTATGAQGTLHVQTAQGRVSATQAQFVVQQRRGANPLQVTTLKGQVALRTPAGETVALAAGRHATLAPQRPPTLAAARGTEAMWTRGLVALDNQPLADLVDAMRDYRPGVLRVDARVAQMRISGVFSLDDTERTLRVLAETQPVRVNTRTPYWVTIEAA